MAERIVDFLEVIQVDEQQRNGQPASAGAQAGRIQPLDERATVEYPGQ
jgi:hypothetical protein